MKIAVAGSSRVLPRPGMKGNTKDEKKRQHIARLLVTGHSYSAIQEMLGCSRYLIASVAKEARS
ncbi:helix-turn-helix domain-containing protein [Edwardsiella tarda]